MLPFMLAAALLAEPPTSGQIVVVSGDWSITFDAARAWTIHHIDWRGRTLSHGRGFHGLVYQTGTPVKPGATVSFVGTGHDEGGREQVESLVLTVDGQEQPPEIDRTYRAQCFVLRKRSLLANLRHEAEITVEPAKVTERHQLEALQDQPVNTLYAFMHCWETSFNRWLAKLPDGALTEGEFTAAKDFKVRADVAWSSLFDETAGVGVVTGYPEVYRTMFNAPGTVYWDQPVYHKQYLWVAGKGTLTKGTKLDWTLGLNAFAATADTWRAAAAAQAEQLFAKKAD
ncbi:MAG: hypothetical protein HUU35_05145 [Armatimonadetes bacterium]|nr:hypothetical protein [Armatimonadota bacterium]